MVESPFLHHKYSFLKNVGWGWFIIPCSKGPIPGREMFTKPKDNSLQCGSLICKKSLRFFPSNTVSEQLYGFLQVSG